VVLFHHRRLPVLNIGMGLLVLAFVCFGKFRAQGLSFEECTVLIPFSSGLLLSLQPESGGKWFSSPGNVTFCITGGFREEALSR